ncbi:MAG: hypothetical protein WA915_16865 [Candidatus Aminicenantaceae bacterium]
MIKGYETKILAIPLLLSLCSISIFSQTLDLKGLIASWGVGSFQKSADPQLGLRFIPELFIEKSLSNNITLDANVSLNAYGVATFKEIDDVRSESDIKPYRLWARFSSSQFEARIGLQKINFGSAMLFRPLMWFDRLDPRDPLQLTDGVYGLLMRYYFVNNGNIWLWGLYGNEDPKGLEVVPTQKDAIEFGGRIQTPLWTGELAFTYHHRSADYSKVRLLRPYLSDSTIPENRYALDGKWDIGVGFWFEGTLIHKQIEKSFNPYQKALTVGMDYTFGWGNGLNILGEYFLFEASQEAWSSGEGIHYGGLSLNYPLALLDTIGLIFFYDWDNNNLYSFVNWRRTYDRWSLNIMGFWNPERFQVYATSGEDNQFAGKGFQIMVVYNY